MRKFTDAQVSRNLEKQKEGSLDIALLDSGSEFCFVEVFPFEPAIQIVRFIKTKRNTVESLMLRMDVWYRHSQEDVITLFTIWNSHVIELKKKRAK